MANPPHDTMPPTLSSQYDPHAIEQMLFDSWMAGHYFEQDAAESKATGQASYVVSIPPPNVTGSLHMGHALNNTIQDALIRYHRMAGRPTRWVLGTDHAGIATQNKVEQKLAKEGKTRFDVGRDRFIELCWEWRDEYGSTIVEQLKRMGCSCDYTHEWFTMDEHYQKAVRTTFVEWFERGLIYRGNRIINWCPRCTTALSDIEVEHEDADGSLWHIRYELDEPTTLPDGTTMTHAVVATTRPETMLGDVAIAVHPSDKRYKGLVGTTATLPLVGRKLTIVADEYVDPEFGTGMVKITPAHDANDFEIGERHQLEQVKVLTDTGTIVDEEPYAAYAGLDRYEARKAIVRDLEAGGYLVEIEEHAHAVGHCYRCHTIIEPYLSEQWFVDMKPLAAPAIEAVRDGRVKIHPQRWEQVYFHWMENIRDWCISRQLWWGHRIPVFYCDACDEMMASMTDITVCPKCDGPVRQDEDVLDTWFSSQLWPFATLGWPDDTPELDYFYPTSTLSTARDILFLWVARMIMSSMDLLDGKIPFSDVIIHPTVFNKEGKRMSKSLGTGVDPLDLMADYGADAMRFGLMLQVTGVQDLKFDDEKLLSSRNFANKIWNASRFVLMNIEDGASALPDSAHPTSLANLSIADRWILSRLANLTETVTRGLEAFQFGEVARALYEFFWSEFCDWYIEFAKGRLQGDDSADRAQVQQTLVFVLDNALRLLHPFMPFLTDEIWKTLPREAHDEALAQSIMVAPWPNAAEFTHLIDPDAEHAIERIKAVVTAARAVRARYGLSPRTELTAMVNASKTDAELLGKNTALITSLGRLESLAAYEGLEKPAQASVTVAAGLEIYIPLDALVDFDAERTKLEKERTKTATDLERYERKLANEGFLAKAAPEIIEKDRAIAAELTEVLTRIDEQLTELG
ncbi:MAG: valine--tRNA ligase [Coriobacteriia bacterium]|nr:valine--tRNA ligase [Coriobacteriia bacterium]